MRRLNRQFPDGGSRARACAALARARQVFGRTHPAETAPIEPGPDKASDADLLADARICGSTILQPERQLHDGPASNPWRGSIPSSASTAFPACA
jgi:hypothetical protein